MKRATRLSLATILLAGAALSDYPALQPVRTVYLMQMSSSLDQYLANRLTRSGHFQVVTDPSLADAVFTDRIGEAFEQRLAELYPPPPPPPAPEKTKDEAPAKSTEEELREKNAAESRMNRVGSFSRGRGNVYLVDRKTKAVIWSLYNRPRDSSPDSMDRAADRIVERLLRDAKKK